VFANYNYSVLQLTRIITGTLTRWRYWRNRRQQLRKRKTWRELLWKRASLSYSSLLH